MCQHHTKNYGTRVQTFSFSQRSYSQLAFSSFNIHTVVCSDEIKKTQQVFRVRSQYSYWFAIVICVCTRLCLFLAGLYLIMQNHHWYSYYPQHFFWPSWLTSAAAHDVALGGKSVLSLAAALFWQKQKTLQPSNNPFALEGNIWFPILSERETGVRKRAPN